MLTSPGFGSLLCIVSELRLFCAHELCVSCPRLFPEEDKVKSGVAHILESHPRENHARVGHPLHGSRMQETNTGKTGPPRLKTVGKSLLTPHPVLELDVHLGSPLV